jgi:hypothetical protein
MKFRFREYELFLWIASAIVVGASLFLDLERTILVATGVCGCLISLSMAVSFHPFVNLILVLSSGVLQISTMSTSRMSYLVFFGLSLIWFFLTYPLDKLGASSVLNKQTARLVLFDPNTFYRAAQGLLLFGIPMIDFWLAAYLTKESNEFGGFVISWIISLPIVLLVKTLMVRAPAKYQWHFVILGGTIFSFLYPVFLRTPFALEFVKPYLLLHYLSGAFFMLTWVEFSKIKDPSFLLAVEHKSLKKTLFFVLGGSVFIDLLAITSGGVSILGICRLLSAVYTYQMMKEFTKKCVGLNTGTSISIKA